MKYKKQHWIPSSYLSAWCDPNTPQGQTPYVWRFSKDGKNSKRKAPKNIFYKSEMYTILRSDGSRNLELEHKLNKLETSFEEIRRDKLSCKSILDDVERFLLYLFLAAMRARTALQRDIQRKNWEEVLHMMDSLAEQWKGYSEKVPKSLLNSSKDRSLSHDNVCELAMNPLQQIMIPMVQAQVEHYMSMNMAILCTDIRPGFVSSDAPLVWYDQNLYERPFPHNQLGLGYETIEVTFPISPQQLLFISWNDNLNTGYVDIDDEKVIDSLNFRTCRSCQNFFVVNEDIKKNSWLEIPKLTSSS